MCVVYLLCLFCVLVSVVCVAVCAVVLLSFSWMFSAEFASFLSSPPSRSAVKPPEYKPAESEVFLSYKTAASETNLSPN